MKKILAYRFSAFGDVAMLASVFREFTAQNPEVQLIMVTRKSFSHLFDGIPNLLFHGIVMDDYKGFLGLRKLALSLKNEYNPDYIADFHDVIRSKILNKIFIHYGYPVYSINKGKEEKEHLTDVWNIDKTPLKKTVERYADVLRRIGFSVVLSHHYPVYQLRKSGIGFAPFAKHYGKVLSQKKSFEIAKILAQHYKVYFFGGGREETEILAQWEKQIPNTKSLAGRMSLDEELKKIASLKLMISMDSANMHLASLSGTRCISVWGATHPFAGFLGYGQSEDDVVQVDDLTCRPCSVFGDKVCYRGDYACLEEISVQQIVDKVLRS